MSLLSETVSTVLSGNITSSNTIVANDITSLNVNADSIVTTSLVSENIYLGPNGGKLTVKYPMLTGAYGYILLSSNLTPSGGPFCVQDTTLCKLVNGASTDGFLYIVTAQKQGGLGATMIQSFDGISWSVHPSPPSGDLNACLYANDLWVCSSSGGGLYYSNDGFTWVACGGYAFPGTVSCLAYAQNKWVAGGNNCFGYSTDGITWTSGTGVVMNPTPYSVAGNNSQFVAVGFDNGGVAMLVSSDGIDWTVPATPPNPFTFGYSVTVNPNGVWVAVTEGAPMYYSLDGITWTSTGFTQINAHSVVWDNSKFVAVGGLGLKQYNQAYSIDGINWQPSTKIINYNGESPSFLITNPYRGTVVVV